MTSADQGGPARPPRLTYAPWGETLAELVAAARAAEQAGAEVIWVPELHRSASVTAAAVAAGTERAGVGTAIMLAFGRSPMTIALEALDLDELSGGRLVLGLGSGVRKLVEDWHDAPWERPVTRLSETVEIVRHFIEHAHTGEPMVVDGEVRRLRVRGYRRPGPPVRTRIPIHLAAVGPAMTRLAGRIGDGWISHELCSPAFLRQRILPALVGTSHPVGPGFDVVVSACCAVDPDGARARRSVAGTVGFYASVGSYAGFFDFHGLGGEQRAVAEAFRAGRGAGELADVVPDPMTEAVTLAGTPDEVAAGIAAYSGLATTIKLSPPVHGLAPDRIRAAQAQIIDLIGELRGDVR